ncbi:MAG: AAA family ATPase [Candidatus Hydrogenedentes bacterium]|nr:AAA family ATPase [Candidatus Hydrogenedentota bacterium]
MRFQKLCLDSYGRFHHRVIDLEPGLQIVLGPNEQGKTTIRNFIGDMLYGQKLNTVQRMYEESHELRRPWQGGERYEGRLTYRLDSGVEIEIHRNFDRNHESIRVMDLTQGRDITGEFGMLRNRELDFAEKHLGVSKTVFLNAATIGHMTLDGLGDEDALTQIRERILALADSSDESGSAEVALKRLDERIARIGRPAAHSKRPLPQVRQRVTALEQELRTATTRRHEIAELEARLLSVRSDRDHVSQQRAVLEAELQTLDRYDRAKRLEEARRVKARIDQTTQQCFALSALREFPLEQATEVQRAANAVATAQAQVDRTRGEHQDLQRQLQEELDRLGPSAAHDFQEISEEMEADLTHLEAGISRLQERLDETARACTKAEQRLAEAQRDLERLPDFSRIDADPVEWLSQLAASFRITQQVRSAEREKTDRMADAIQQLQSAVTEPARVFQKFTDFPIAARDHSVQARVYEEQHTRLSDQLQDLQQDLLEGNERAPGVRLLAAIMAVLLTVFFAGAIYTGNMLVLIPALLSTLALLYFLVVWVYARVGVKNGERDLFLVQDQLQDLEDDWAEQRQSMEAAVKEAGYTSLRELEALYDRYQQDSAELETLEKEFSRQRVAAQEEEEQLQRLFARVREKFAALGEAVESEDDVQPAAGRIIARYQEYRDARRRVAETRDQPAQLAAQRESIERELESARKQEVECALEVRRIMREAGFREESRHTSALSALRAYRVRTAQLRQKRGRIDVLRERAEFISRRMMEEEADLSRQTVLLAKRLAAGGASSVEQWHEQAARARTYRQAWEERTRLEERLDTLLRGEKFEALRKLVEDAGPILGQPARSGEEIKADLARTVAQCEELSAMERDVEIAIAQRIAGLRSPGEIEEDLEQARERQHVLELELEAAAYAAALIEEIARDRHRRIAPALAAQAGAHLDEITAGAYSELLINRDLRITIRIPQISQLSADPERRLSKGPVDQIYLALRLALVQGLSKGAESIPMLLDDPFANYDDARLARALALLQRISASNQVLLFTCREDVARAAEGLAIPVTPLRELAAPQDSRVPARGEAQRAVPPS